MAHALLMREAKEGFQRLAIGCDAVGEELVAEDMAHLARMFIGPGQGDQAADIEHALDAEPPRRLESTVEIDRNPRVRFEDFPADGERMHDREDARRAHISLLDGTAVLEQPPHIGMA